jgi:hypothetical protein
MAMASNYDPATYDCLPSLATAGKMFEDRNGEELVDNAFGELFLQHKMERTFGLVLLHRHFDLRPGSNLSNTVAHRW